MELIFQIYLWKTLFLPAQPSLGILDSAMLCRILLTTNSNKNSSESQKNFAFLINLSILVFYWNDGFSNIYNRIWHDFFYDASMPWPVMGSLQTILAIFYYYF